MTKNKYLNLTFCTHSDQKYVPEFNPIALRGAKTPQSFGPSRCNRVDELDYIISEKKQEAILGKLAEQQEEQLKLIKEQKEILEELKQHKEEHIVITLSFYPLLHSFGR